MYNVVTMFISMLLLAVMFSWVIYMSLHMFDMNINHRIMVEGDYTDLNDRINTLEGKVSEATSKVSELTSKVSEATSKVRELTARLNELETQ